MSDELHFFLLQGVLQIGSSSARKDDPCICAPVLIGGCTSATNFNQLVKFIKKILFDLAKDSI